MGIMSAASALLMVCLPGDPSLAFDPRHQGNTSTPKRPSLCVEVG